MATLTFHNAGSAASGGTMYLFGDNTDDLLSVNTTTGAATSVFSLSQRYEAMTYHDGVLYAATSTSLYTIDTTVGSETLIAAFSTSPIRGLSSHNGVMYTTQLGRLATVDPSTAALTFVHPTNTLSSDSIRGMESHNGSLYFATSTGAEALYVVDTNDGTATEIGALGISNTRGLASDGVTMYTTDLSLDALFTVDVSTGATTRVGTEQDFGISEGRPFSLVFVPDNSPPIVTFPDDYPHPSVGAGILTIGNVAQPDGTIATRRFRNSDAVASAGTFTIGGVSIPHEFQNPPPVPLTPFASPQIIAPDNPLVFDTLNSALSQQENVASASYQWRRGSTEIGTGETYELTNDDSGQTASLFVTLTSPSGEVAIVQTHYAVPTLPSGHRRVVGAAGGGRTVNGFTYSNNNYFIGARGNFQTAESNGYVGGRITLPNGELNLARYAASANALLVEFAGNSANPPFTSITFRRDGFDRITFLKSQGFNNVGGGINRWRWNDTGANAALINALGPMLATGITGTTNNGNNGVAVVEFHYVP